LEVTSAGQDLSDSIEQLLIGSAGQLRDMTRPHVIAYRHQQQHSKLLPC
jgi:hypothetical protein